MSNNNSSLKPPFNDMEFLNSILMNGSSGIQRNKSGGFPGENFNFEDPFVLGGNSEYLKKLKE